MVPATHNEHVKIHADAVEMDGILWLPDDCLGMVLFANGGGSSRVTPPNDYVASVLRRARLGTLWLDLLAPQEAKSHKARFDIKLLTERLGIACDWLRQNGMTRELPLGLYGASNGAAAALQLAAERDGIAAVVSRGGRPDLADQNLLGKVNAPTLLIVGGLDDAVVKMNRAAYAALHCKKRFEIIPGATHSFEEPGNLEVVARLARAWFLQHSQPAHV